MWKRSEGRWKKPRGDHHGGSFFFIWWQEDLGEIMGAAEPGARENVIYSYCFLYFAVDARAVGVV